MIASTFRGDSNEPEFDAKSLSVGWSSVTQSGGETAELPGGSDSERESSALLTW